MLRPRGPGSNTSNSFADAVKKLGETKDAATREKELGFLTGKIPPADIPKAVTTLLDRLTAIPRVFQVGREIRLVEDAVFRSVQVLVAKDIATARKLATTLDASTFETSDPGTPWIWPAVADSSARLKAAIALRCLAFLSDEVGIRGDATCVRFDSNFYDMMSKNVRSPHPIPPNAPVPPAYVDNVLRILYPILPSRIGAGVAKHPETAPLALILALVNFAAPDVASSIAARAHSTFTAEGGRLTKFVDSLGTNGYKFPAEANPRDSQIAQFHFSVLLTALAKVDGDSATFLTKPRELVARYPWWAKQAALFPADLHNLPFAGEQIPEHSELFVARAVAGRSKNQTPEIATLRRLSAAALESVQSGKLRPNGRRDFEGTAFSMALNYLERQSEKGDGRMRYPSVGWNPKGDTGPLVGNAFDQVAAYVHATAGWILAREDTDHMNQLVSWAWHPCMDRVFPVLAAVFSPSFPPELLKKSDAINFLEREAVVVRGVKLFQETRRWDPHMNDLRFSIPWLHGVLQNTIEGGTSDGAAKASSELRDLLFRRRYQHSDDFTLTARLSQDLGESSPTDGAKFNRQNLFQVFDALVRLNGVCAAMSEPAAQAFARDVGTLLRPPTTLHPRLQPILRTAYVDAISHIKDGNTRSAILGETGVPVA